MKNNKLNILIAVGLILMAGVARIVNQKLGIYHLAPVAALGLFSGAIIKDKRYAYLLPLFAQLLGDLYFQFFTSVQGFYGIDQAFVYAGMLAVTFLGTKMGNPRALKIAGYSITGSLIFFIISNFGVWVSIQFGVVDLYGYGMGFQGLINTFAAALPFYSKDSSMLFLNSFVGDLIFSGVLFGAYALLQKALSGKMQKAEA